MENIKKVNAEREHNKPDDYSERECPYCAKLKRRADRANHSSENKKRNNSADVK